MSAELSPAAAIFLIAIDPKTGRLVKRRRQRFRKALRRAGGSKRKAVRELRRRGLIERSLVPGRYPHVPGAKAGVPFARVKQNIEKGFERPEDALIFALLAWSGVLKQRLTPSEIWVARWRSRDLSALATGDTYEPMRRATPEAVATAPIVWLQQMEIVQEAIGDLLSGGEVTFELGGGEAGGGFEGGESP